MATERKDKVKDGGGTSDSIMIVNGTIMIVILIINDIIMIIILQI